MSKTTKTETTEGRLFADINISMKTGRLVKNPEETSEGKFVKLRIASNRQYLDKNKELKTVTNYFNALVSKNLKEAFNVAKDLNQGDWVYLKGEDSTQSFDTPEGYKKTASTIFAYKVVLKKENTANQTQDNPTAEVA